MPACANCARELRPEWKFCVSCGMPTGVTAARPETKAIPIVAIPAAESAPEPVVMTPPAPILVAAPAPEPVLAAPEPVTAPASAPAALATVAAVPALIVAPTEPDPVLAPVPVRTRSGRTRSGRSTRRRRVNALAIVALVLGCIANPLAALFGHLALHQIAIAKERGRIPALIAIVLGYGSLAFIVGIGLIYLTSRG